MQDTNQLFTTRELYLAAAIEAPRAPSLVKSEDGTVALFRCKSEVPPKDLEPPDAAHFAGLALAGEVPSGFYLFLQGFIDESPHKFLQGIAEGLQDTPRLESRACEWIKVSGKSEEAALIARASKELWLESLWLEAAFASNEFFLRLLEEEEKSVFQLFRAIKTAQG